MTMNNTDPQGLGERFLTVEMQTGPGQYEVYQGPGRVFYYPPNGTGASYFVQTACGGERMLFADEVEVDEGQLTQLGLEARIGSGDPRQVTDREIDAALEGLSGPYVQ